MPLTGSHGISVLSSRVPQKTKMQLIASPQPAKAKLLASGLIKGNAASGLYRFLFFSLMVPGGNGQFCTSGHRAP